MLEAVTQNELAEALHQERQKLQAANMNLSASRCDLAASTEAMEQERTPSERLRAKLGVLEWQLASSRCDLAASTEVKNIWIPYGE